MDDKYDKAIDYLMRHPNEVKEAWSCPPEHPAGCLFEFACRREVLRGFNNYGCLTMIRRVAYPSDVWQSSVAETPELTEAIQADNRLPMHVDEIQLHHLPVFAEWQRRLDRELGR